MYKLSWIYLSILLVLTMECMVAKKQYIECERGDEVKVTAIPLNHNVDQYLVSPNYPNYFQTDTECEFLLKAKESDHIIAASVEVISLGDCSTDGLKFYDGDSDDDTLIGKTCSEEKLFLSTGKYMYIEFKSEAERSVIRRFKIHFYSFDAFDKSSLADSLSEGGIIGVVVGVLVVASCLILFIVCYWERIKKTSSCCLCCCTTQSGPPPPITVAVPHGQHTASLPMQDVIGPPPYSNKFDPDSTVSDLPPSYEEIMSQEYSNTSLSIAPSINRK